MQFDINPTNSATDIATWDQFYLSVSNPGVGGGSCSSADFSFIVAGCTVGAFAYTPSQPLAVSQLKTAYIGLATIQSPVGAGCTGSIFQANPATLPNFITWSAPNTLIISPTLSTSIGPYVVEVGYG